MPVGRLVPFSQVAIVRKHVLSPRCSKEVPSGIGRRMATATEVGAGRKHVIVFSGKCLFLDFEEDQETLNSELTELASNPDFETFFTSHSTPTREMIAAIGETMDSSHFVRRGKQLQDFIMEKWSAKKMVIICGAVDEDLHVAATSKSFLIAAGWVVPEGKVRKYGVPAPTPRKMRAILEIVANQTSWYYSCSFNDPVPTKVVSLCLSNTYTTSGDEKVMAQAFQGILKDGANNLVIKQALMCHLMAAIAHDSEFREVQDWAVAPSSSTQLNEVMEELKEHVRYMMNGRKPQPIFIRHTETTKSRFDRRERRQEDNYCQKHFTTICVNDDKTYKGKLKGRVVCVFDDYLTNGNTFETLRNLLVACKVKKIIFLSIGKFVSHSESFYTQKSYAIQGDVDTPNYTATFTTASKHFVTFNEDARRSLKDLRKLVVYLHN